LFGQTQIIDSLVTVDISTIREANKKLLEREYLLKIVDTQTSIISDYKVISEKQDSLIYKYQIKNINLEKKIISLNSNINSLTNKLNKQKTISTIFGSTTAASLLALIIVLLL
jgi:hypothetical protein